MPGEVKTNSVLAQQLRERINKDNPQPLGSDTTDTIADRLLFMGNWHDAIPRALVLDPLLQSTDKCVYLLLRTYLTASGSTRMPSYDQIGALLSLSRGTIARSLHILRAARWITLCNALRDDSTGRFKGNTYAIHDEVLSIQEAMVLDGHYIEVLEDLEHHHKHQRVRRVAYAVLENLRNDLHQEEPDQPLEQQYGHLISRFLGGPPENHINSPIVHVQKLDSGNHPVKILDSVAVTQENQSLNHRVQKIDSVVTNLNSVTDDSSSYINNINIKTTTTTPNPNKTQTQSRPSSKQPLGPGLIWPSSLSGDARWVAWQALQRCPSEHHQDLLDELAARLLPSSKNPIKNPSAWLAWASKELRTAGVYPITNLAVNHRRLREREQQRKLGDPGNPQGVGIKLTGSKQTNGTDGLQHVAALKTALGNKR
jgi:hypothetical protein